MSTFEPDAPQTSVGLRQYLDVIRRRKWTVVGTTALALGIAAAIAFTQKSIYAAQSKIVIGQGSSLFQVQNGNSIQPFTATMADLLQSSNVAELVIRDLHLDYSTTHLLSEVSVTTNPQTAVLKLKRNGDESLTVSVQPK